MTIGAFGVIALLSRNGIEAHDIDDLHGLNTRNPWLAFMMLLVMFSMAGIPPMVGFFAKVGVLEALIHVHMEWLAVYALVMAIIGAFYYIRVVKVMYFDAPADPTPYEYHWDARIAISVTGLAVLVLGLVPGWLFQMCHMAF